MAGVSDTTWSGILDHLRTHHGATVRPWFDHLEPAQMTGGVIEIRAANADHQRYLTESCRLAFTEAAQAMLGRLVTVAFTLAPDAPPTPDSTALDEPELLLSNDYRFEHFVTGPCNRMAHAACVAVSESLGRAYNPLFLHGTSGLGKTHLLQAVCHRAMEHSRKLNVLFLSCETFANHFIEAVESGDLRRFRYRYRHVDLLAIDDVQLLADRERSQEEFFHTFNTLYQGQKQIILSSDTPPREIASLEERLVSRFGWGLVTRLDTPCLETRIAILRTKAKLKCLDLSDEVIAVIASRTDSNTRDLEGALMKVHALSLQYAGQMTAALADEALSDSSTLSERVVTIPAIIEEVVLRFPVKASDIHGRKRTKSIALPRQVCMYLARQLTPLSLEEIGSYFGGRDHSTVLHASRNIAKQRESNPSLDRALDDIAATLKR